jgi:pimeloyl-ACP methyl ester carboxylesterase
MLARAGSPIAPAMPAMPELDTFSLGVMPLSYTAAQSMIRSWSKHPNPPGATLVTVGQTRLKEISPVDVTPAVLDARERHFLIPGPDEAQLFLRLLPAGAASRGAVLYVHGATFHSASSIAHRFDGRSWRDALCDAGFDVWGLDFRGFGASSRYAEMQQPALDNPPLCASGDAAAQLEAAVRFILSHQGGTQLALISHSWGSIPAGRLCAAHPELVQRWVLFGPIARRPPRRYESAPRLPAWKVVTLEDQWQRFNEDIPPGEPAVLAPSHFREWGELYLDSDAEGRSREPPGVKVPLGPFSDIMQAWHGSLAYDPAAVRCPIAIIRGAWDGVLPDEDARWLFNAFIHSPVKRDIKIARGTHLMHLETMRTALWKESVAFLEAE